MESDDYGFFPIHTYNLTGSYELAKEYLHSGIVWFYIQISSKEILTITFDSDSYLSNNKYTKNFLCFQLIVMILVRRQWVWGIHMMCGNGCILYQEIPPFLRYVLFKRKEEDKLISVNGVFMYIVVA